MTEHRILIVEDDPAASAPIEAALTAAGYRTRTARSQSEALAGVGEFQPDVILMDVSLGESGDGIDTAQRVKDRDGTPLIYVTAHDDEQTFARARGTLPFAFLEKPVRMPMLFRTIQLAIAQREQRRTKDGAAPGAATDNLTGLPMFTQAALSGMVPHQAVCAIFELQNYSFIATRHDAKVADQVFLRFTQRVADFFKEAEKNGACKATLYRATGPMLAAVIEAGTGALSQLSNSIQQFLTSRRNQLLDLNSSGALVTISAAYRMLGGTDPAGWLHELVRRKEGRIA